MGRKRCRMGRSWSHMHKRFCMMSLHHALTVQMRQSREMPAKMWGARTSCGWQLVQKRCCLGELDSSKCVWLFKCVDPHAFVSAVMFLVSPAEEYEYCVLMLSSVTSNKFFTLFNLCLLSKREYPGFGWIYFKVNLLTSIIINSCFYLFNLFYSNTIVKYI